MRIRFVWRSLVAVGLACGVARADLIESFDVVNDLAPPATDGAVTPSGWVGALRSQPLGVSGIFQGNLTVFGPHAGASYLGANFQNAAGIGTISTWIISPELLLQNGDTVSFWTRVPTDGGLFPDRLQLRMSTAGSSTDVGATADSVGDFTTLLLSVNPNLTTTDYPEVWTEFSTTITGLGGPTNGRLAFRYFVTDAGPSGFNSNYIGIDTFSHVSVPEPATVVLAGLALLGATRRRA